MSIKGKTAVVTGAAGNAALTVVRALLEDGAQVALVDPDAMRLDSLIRFLRGTTAAVPCESSEAGAVREAHQKVETVLGPVDILINCADAPAAVRSDATDSSDWRRILGLQLDGAFYWSRAVIPSMRKRNEGRILNMVSPAAKGAMAEPGAVLAACHGALASLTFALARETAANGITVNAIALGSIEGSSAVEPLNDAQRRQLLAQIPVGRFCKPEELAHAVRFLVSPLAGFITGEVLDLNGGLLMD